MWLQAFRFFSMLQLTLTGVLGFLALSAATLHADLVSRSSAAAVSAQQIFERRVAQTLLDTSRGEQSVFLNPIVSQQQLRTFVSHRSGQSFSYETADGVNQTGIYRIAFQERTPTDLAAAWWQLVERSPEMEIWRRTQRHAGTEQAVYTARTTEGDFSFLVRFEYPATHNGLGDIRRRLNALIANARSQRLFDEQSRTRDLSRMASFVGLWAGPMRNTRGSVLERSELRLSLDEQQGIIGEWHMGWSVREVSEAASTAIVWEHSNVGNCRDYRNRLVLNTAETNRATLYYEVTDRCAEGEVYSGMHFLTRQ